MPEQSAPISFHQACGILEAVGVGSALPVEQVAISHCRGRVLAADMVAPIALQPFDNSAMDGYACRHVDLHDGGATSLCLVGEQFAGLALGLRIEAGECVRITTGAPIPDGADTVVIREQATVDGRTITLATDARAGANIRKAGEDAVPGEVILHAGTVLGPVQASLASSLGLDRLPVSARPTVAVFTTGDELVEPGLPLRPGR